MRVFDFGDTENNDFLAVNQFTVTENNHECRPDVLLFINGLPLGVIELKNAADENATLWNAFNQLQTYKQQISSLFTWNAALVVSDGVQARIGTLTADRERFMPWRTIAGEDLAPTSMPELQVVLEGVFEKARILQLLRHFIVFAGKLNQEIAVELNTGMKTVCQWRRRFAERGLAGIEKDRPVQILERGFKSVLNRGFCERRLR